MVKGACMAKGGMCGERGACVVCTPLHEIQPVIAQAVRILLECILVSQASVCPQGGGVSASVHAGIPPLPTQTRHPPEQTPLEQTPPLKQTPLDQAPPRPCTSQSRHPLWDQAYPPEQTPPQSRPPWTRQTAAYSLQVAGTHPTGMHSCFLYIFSQEDVK